MTGVRPRIREGRTVAVYLFSLQWARLLGQCGKRNGKHLPTEYLCGNPLYLRGLLDGLVDSNGHVEPNGRVCFRNTSRQLVELFGVLAFLLEGAFPSCVREEPSAGGLRGTSDERCKPSFRSRLDVLDSEGERIGYFKSKFFTISGGFHVYDKDDQHFAEVKGKLLGWNYRFLTPDGKVEMGKVSKKLGEYSEGSGTSNRAALPTEALDKLIARDGKDALKDFEGTMIFVSHDRVFLRGLGSRVLELGGESGTERNPRVYPGSYIEYVQALGHEAPGIYS